MHEAGCRHDKPAGWCTRGRGEVKSRRASGRWANGAKAVRGNLRASRGPACRDSAGRWLRLILPRRPSSASLPGNESS